MNALERIAEERERQALEAGELDNLPGAGRPLELGDDRDVPEELRAAYRVLRNSGLLPEEVSMRRDINVLQASLAGLAAGDERSRAARRLALLRMQLESRGGQPRARGYDAALAAKLDR